MGKKQQKSFAALAEKARLGKASEQELAAAYKQIQGMQAAGPTGIQRAKDFVGHALPGEKSMVLGMGAMGASGGMAKTDPKTGRKRGIGERIGRATAGAAGAAAMWPLYMPQAARYGAGASKMLPTMAFSIPGTMAGQKAYDVTAGGGGKLIGGVCYQRKVWRHLTPWCDRQWQDRGLFTCS